MGLQNYDPTTKNYRQQQFIVVGIIAFQTYEKTE